VGTYLSFFSRYKATPTIIITDEIINIGTIALGVSTKSSDSQPMIFMNNLALSPALKNCISLSGRSNVFPVNIIVDPRITIRLEPYSKADIHDGNVPLRAE
jgi:hypothetical protein